MELSELLDIKKEKISSYTQLIKSSIKNQHERIVLSLGSNNFDKILNGGFCSGKVYLIFGANSTGKTQICHQLCVQAYKYNLENIILLDTENTFRPERIKQLCEARDLDVNDALKRILISSIMGSSILSLSLEKVENELKKKPGGLLIIDSINNYFRLEQANSYDQAKTTFIALLKKINELTQKFNLITIATAQVTPNFSEHPVIRELPVGIMLLNHFFSEFLYLDRKEDNQNSVHLFNSHSLPEKKLLYTITSNGIED